MYQGLQAYLSLPLRYVGENKLTWRGSYDVQVAARLQWTATKALAPEESPSL